MHAGKGSYPCSGSKRRLLDRLVAFKISVENTDAAVHCMQASCARSNTEGISCRTAEATNPEPYFVIHLPYAPWCQALITTRAKEDTREQKEENTGELVVEGNCKPKDSDRGGAL